MKQANTHARRGALVSVVAALLTLPVTASAQANDPPREAFEAGVRSLAERRFRDAADAFERSYGLRPLPVVLYNRALAYRGMGRYLSAINDFDAYLAAPDPSATPERLAAIREEVRDLRAQLVELTITPSPEDAVVSIDGHPLPARTAVTALDPGPHVIDVVRLGHRPEHREIVGAPGARVPFAVSLAPIRDGRLQVECAVPAARITVDGGGASHGRASLALPPGEHRVEVSAEGYLPYHRTVVVGFTGTVRLDVTLSERPNWVLRGFLIGGAAAAVGGLLATALLWPAARDAHQGTWDNTVAP